LHDCRFNICLGLSQIVCSLQQFQVKEGGKLGEVQRSFVTFPHRRSNFEFSAGDMTKRRAALT
jgi:hypothetical protein